MIAVNQPLSNVQVELMKIYSTNISDNDLQELRDVLAQFYARNAIANANKAWEEKQLSNDIMEQWLDEN